MIWDTETNNINKHKTFKRHLVHESYMYMLNMCFVCVYSASSIVVRLNDVMTISDTG